MVKKPNYEVVMATDSANSYVGIRPAVTPEEYRQIMAKLGRPLIDKDVRAEATNSEKQGVTELPLGKSLSTSQLRSKAEMIVEALPNASLLTDDVVLPVGPDLFEPVDK